MLFDFFYRYLNLVENNLKVEFMKRNYSYFIAQSGLLAFLC